MRLEKALYFDEYRKLFYYAIISDLMDELVIINNFLYLSYFFNKLLIKTILINTFKKKKYIILGCLWKNKHLFFKIEYFR